MDLPGVLMGAMELLAGLLLVVVVVVTAFTGARLAWRVVLWVLYRD